MKKLYIASGLLALLGAATSCDKYDIYPEQYGKVLMIKDAGDRSVTIYSTEYTSPCYVSVMKSGHSPENPADATVKVLSDDEFSAYKAKFYGRPDFEGLVMLDPKFFTIADANRKPVENNQLTHHFSDASDRYFGINVMFDGVALKDWIEELGGSLPDDKAFVVPIGVFSPNDSVNADNQYVMIQPSVEDPVLKVSVNDGAYHITDLSRSKLVNDAEYKAGIFEPEVTLSIPCTNPWGFKAPFKVTDNMVDEFMEWHKDIQLYNLTSKKDEPERYDFTKEVEFPEKVTEVRLPLSIFKEHIDADGLDMNYVVPIQCNPGGRRPVSPKIDMLWADDMNDKKIKERLKLPIGSIKKENSEEKRYGGLYTFFVGYRVIETPLEIDENSVLYFNDCEPSEGSVAALFDDDLSTFFHSAWREPVYRTKPYGSYLDFELPTAVNAVAIQASGRVGNNVSPKKVALYYTQKSSYKDTDPDNSGWKPFEKDSYTVDAKDGKIASGGVGWFGGIKKDTDWMRPKTNETFNVVRFCVLENENGIDITTTDGGKGYWNLSELKIYGTILK